MACSRTEHGADCCGSSRRISIIEYIERGLRRGRQPPLATAGDWLHDADSRAVRFSVQTQDGRIHEVRFNASFCVTLIAYCEVLAERATGTASERAARIRPAELTDALVCVPPYKRHLAALATEALSSAIQKTGGLK